IAHRERLEHVSDEGQIAETDGELRIKLAGMLKLKSGAREFKEACPLNFQPGPALLKTAQIAVRLGYIENRDILSFRVEFILCADHAVSEAIGRDGKLDGNERLVSVV